MVMTECKQQLVVENITNCPSLKLYEESLRVLSDSCIESSLTGPVEWLLPMFEYLRASESKDDVLVARTNSGKVVGVLPISRRKYRWIVPVPMVDNWDNEFFFDGVPLIDKDYSHEVIGSFLKSVAGMFGARVLLFRTVVATGEFRKSLQSVTAVRGLGFAEIESYERAVLNCDCVFDKWYIDSVSSKRRKEYRRLKSRLDDLGSVKCVSLEEEPLSEPWVSDFIKLEQAGWKGAAGTAIGCREDMTDFVKAMVSAQEVSGNLLFWKLTLDGKTLATLFAIVHKRKAWLIKIAYDEKFSHYSPGVLLVLDVTRRLLDDGNLDIVDSSAIPDHPMINKLWRDRLTITDIVVASPGTSGLVFKVIVGAEKCRRAIRAQLKSAYHFALKNFKRG